jgi:hypothetical protein
MWKKRIISTKPASKCGTQSHESSVVIFPNETDEDSARWACGNSYFSGFFPAVEY